MYVCVCGWGGGSCWMHVMVSHDGATHGGEGGFKFRKIDSSLSGTDIGTSCVYVDSGL